MDYAVHGILQARVLEWVAFPRDRGAWWAAVYVVTQSRTRLMRLSSSSSSLSLPQGNSPPQGSNPSLLHCKQILYQLSHKGKQRQSLTRYFLSIHPRQILFEAADKQSSCSQWNRGRAVQLVYWMWASGFGRRELESSWYHFLGLHLGSPICRMSSWVVELLQD